MNKDLDVPPTDLIHLAVRMMSVSAAPTFPSKREKRMATLDLARQLWKSAR